MPSRTWHTRLDDAPLELGLEHDPSTHQVVVRVDGFPAHREQLPLPLTRTSKVVVDVGGHRVAFVIEATPQGFAYHAALDGQDLERGTAEHELARPPAGEPHLPARLSLAPGLYYACHPTWPRRAGMAIVAGITMLGWAALDAWRTDAWTEGSTTLAVFAGSMAVIAVGWLASDLRRQRARFQWGDARPGVVVALDPVRVAVPVDLALDGEAPAPCLKVAEVPLDRVTTPALGDRVLVVVLYQDSQDGRRWHDVDATAALCGTKDDQRVDALTRELSPTDWARAEQWWHAVGRPTQVGLHEVGPTSP